MSMTELETIKQGRSWRNPKSALQESNVIINNAKNGPPRPTVTPQSVRK